MSFSRLRRLEGPVEFLSRPGPWVWLLCAAGALLRLFLVLSTAGTADVFLWTRHAAGIALNGLMAHYAAEPLFNHPPFIGWVMAELWSLSQVLGVPFEWLYRGLTATLDLGSAFLLLRVLAGSRYRWVAFGLYCLSPAALILSAMHGNTDAIIAFALLGCCLAAGAGRPILCGVLLGLSLWIKLPALVAAPAIGFALPRWRDRVTCAMVTLAVALAGFLPVFVLDFPLVWERVFRYRGLYIHTTSNPPIWAWGLKNFFIPIFGPDFKLWPGWAIWRIDHGNPIAMALVTVYAFLRRRETGALGLAQTLAASFALFYAGIETWTFQYFAWSVPFWFTRGVPFAMSANLLAGGYLYGLYAFVCEDWLLRPEWNFAGHPVWPAWLIVLRDGAVLTFLGFGLWWFAQAVAAEHRAWRERPRQDRGAASPPSTPGVIQVRR